MDRKELTMLQSLPLDIKIAKTKLRIREAIEHFGVDGVYVPVSGGIDSTVLSHIVEQYQKEWNIPKESIPRVNSNTGNEYDGVLAMARKISDIEVRPKMTPYEVWTYEGYPVASKKTSRMIRDIQNPTEKNYNTRNLYLTGIKINGEKGSSQCKLAKRWYPFIDENQEFKIKCSEKCCDILKKEPLKRYEKENKRIPLIGTMADEGGSREQGYLQTGCNAFENKKSMPIGFWTKQDILEYVLKYNIEIAPEYGEIKRNEEGKLYTTLEERTGCFCCTFGVQFEKGENRFQRMKRLYPQKYKFCIEGGEVNENNEWVPKNGLGMAKVLDRMGIDYGKYSDLKVGSKFINCFNNIETKILSIEEESVVLSQKKENEKLKDIKLTKEWLYNLIKNETIKEV